jgi:hypothetical protein
MAPASFDHLQVIVGLLSEFMTLLSLIKLIFFHSHLPASRVIVLKELVRELRASRADMCPLTLAEYERYVC